MNIVYGGSFNPPTLAHKRIYELLKEKFNPENIIIVPTPESYHLKELASFSDRINMCKIQFKGAIVSQVEDTKAYGGTLATLDKLSEDYKDLYFTMGADNLITIKKWIKYEELLKKYNFIIFRRNNIDIELFVKEELNEFKDHFTFVDFDMNISSTEFRNSFDENLVDKDVLKYIKAHKLYEEV